ncbi:MAG: hypothetical protein K2H41_15700 [Acetatifactor sp.]|nr:hypothetical protein [Acetatifactor sp.]
MENSERFNDVKEAKEIGELIEKYFKLQAQINNPTKDGMIEALSDAQNVARQEITMVEHSQGDIYPMLWSDFSYNDLYRKLSQYQQGLYNHAVNKLGEEGFKTLLKEHTKARQNQ